MFYSAQVLCKKGPLATIWIAAHLDRRLKRRDVFTTNITSSVDNIIDPQTPLALRLSGQLLLGVVKIYSKQVAYLFDDCGTAIVKIQQVFKPADGNLLEGAEKLSEEALTLPADLNELDLFGTSFRAYDRSEVGSEMPALFQLDGQENFTLTDEASSQFEAQLSMPEEQFEAINDDMEMMLEAPEQLREAPLAPLSGRKHYEEAAQSTPGLPEQEEQLIVPPDDDMPPMQPPSPLRPPSSHASERSQASFGSLGLRSSDGGANAGILDVPSGGGGLDDLLGGLTPDPASTPSDMQAGQTAQKSSRKPPRTPQAGGQQQKLKKVRLDVADGLVATQLAGAGIRTLLANSAPLLRSREPAIDQMDPPEARAAALNDDSEAGAAEPLLLPMGDATAMAPALRQAYQHSWHSSKPYAKKRESGKARNKAPASPQAEVRHEPEAGPESQPDVQMPDAEVVEEAMQHMQDNLMTDGDALPAEPEQDGFTLPEEFAPDDRSQFTAEPLEANGQTPRDATSPDAMSTGSGPRAPTLSGPSQGDSNTEDTDNQNSFTSRTRAVLKHLQATFGQEAGSAASRKKRRISANAAQSVKSVGLDSLTQGKTRQDASRWFFEVLVLKSRGFVELQQNESYADIHISPSHQLSSKV